MSPYVPAGLLSMILFDKFRLDLISKHCEMGKILRNVLILILFPDDKAIPWTALAALAVKNSFYIW